MIDMSGTELHCIASGQLANRRLRPTLHLSSGVDLADARQDLLHRFTPTPYARDLQLMQRTVRLETNNGALLNLAWESFERHQHGKVAKPQFLWRIVCESDPDVQSTALPVSAFSDVGLRYASVGQRGFLAIDLSRRKAVGFLPDQFVESGARFRDRPPLNLLLCMTSSSLGLTALCGGCVGLRKRAVLVFGPPNSGKTTASYLAAKFGADFHSDQVVFLDVKRNVLRAWGDPFPAVFRPETVGFLPELRELSHPGAYANISFYYFDKKPMQARRASPVTPICSVFLHRVTEGAAELKTISPGEAVSQLRSYTLFNESPEFDEQVDTAVNALARKPSFSLRYRSDPNIAAEVIREMLE